MAERTTKHFEYFIVNPLSNVKISLLAEYFEMGL